MYMSVEIGNHTIILGLICFIYGMVMIWCRFEYAAQGKTIHTARQGINQLCGPHLQ